MRRRQIWKKAIVKNVETRNIGHVFIME